MIPKKNDSLFLLGAAGVGYFVVIKPILVALGLIDSKKKKNIDDAGNTGNSNNPFSPQYYKSRNCDIMTRASANLYAKQIFDAFGFFGDNEDAAIAVFRQLKSKCQVSFLADVFAQNYQKDLFTYLRDGSQSSGFWGGLSDDDLQTVLSIVNNLK